MSESGDDQSETAQPSAGQFILDHQDNVIGGDAAIIGYHLAQGGEQGGCLALPPLLQLVAEARSQNGRAHRRVRFVAGDLDISCWASAAVKAEETSLHLSRIVAKQRDISATPIPSQFALRLLADGWLHVDGDLKIMSAAAAPAYAAQNSDAQAQIQAAIGQTIDAVMRPVGDNALVELYDKGHWPEWRDLDRTVMTVNALPTNRWSVRIFPMEQTDICEWLLLPLHGAVADTGLIDPESNRLFVDTVAPALRGPIERIKANAESIYGQSLGELQQDYIGYAGNIADAADHLLALVEDASAMEEIDNPKQALKIEEIDLAEIARRACDLLAIKASDRNIRIIAPHEAETASCHGDRHKVMQILLNLIGNAIRYSPEKTAVFLSLEQNDDAIRLTVADQGEGLTEEQQAVIFNKYERLGRSGDGGSGLGLYISRRLARAMQGDLVVESAPGQGARFILELPSA